MKISLLALEIIQQLQERLAQGVLDWHEKANTGLKSSPDVSQSKVHVLLTDSLVK